MNCGTNNDGTKSVLLIFKRDLLMYDIENYAYIEGHQLDTENSHQRHAVQDIGEGGNVDRVSRVLDIAVSQCREMLYPYTKRGVAATELFNRFNDTTIYGIELALPQGFSQTTLSLLKKLIHEYLVTVSVADWLSITNPAKAETWAVKAREAENAIRACVNSRISRIRRRCHPF